MDQLQQCPVCTLYLHSGMSMEEHLDTHPKDQVIRALCKMSGRGFNSRCTTPAQSERSYCSRSRTPASVAEGSKFGDDKERRKRTTRTPASRCETPASVFRPDSYAFGSNSGSQTPTSFSNRSEVTSYARGGPMSDASQYVYVQDQNEETELKYSRTDEYNMNQVRNPDFYPYNVPFSTTRLRAPRLRQDSFEMYPKQNNNVALLKTNVAPVQYLNQAVKPVQIMVPSHQGFVQQNNNMVLTNGVSDAMQPTTSKNVAGTVYNQVSHMSSGAFTPGTVVTQNSQFYYREMVHNVDGKPYVSTVPAVVSAREDLNSTPSNPIYQNVMVVNPYTNASCMYPPQNIVVSTSNVSNVSQSVNDTTDRRPKPSVRPHTASQTLIIEVGPIEKDVEPDPSSVQVMLRQDREESSMSTREQTIEQDNTTKKGLKILSNIKVEVPITHHSSMLHGVMDLTGDEVKVVDVNKSNESSLSATEENKSQSSTTIENDCMVNTFSVIKNIGNPSNNRESTPKLNFNENKIEVDQNDSCSIPDLTCKEKASISPCSELSEDFADNNSNPLSVKDEMEEKDEEPVETFRHNNLLNIYSKKSKKILQIKNFKGAPISSTSNENKHSDDILTNDTDENKSMDEKLSMPVNLQTTKQNDSNCCTPKMTEMTEASTSRQEVAPHVEFDADTEEQSMDIEPMSHSSFKDQCEITREESRTEPEKKDFTQLETMRPVNVISYGNLSNLECNKEFESAKDRFVTMMNDNYFGDNIIGDYFIAERSDTFSHVQRDERCTFEVQKTELPALEEEQTNEYMWGESSHILPNFMQESYREYTAEDGLELEGSEYAELRCRPTYDKYEKTEVERSADGEMALDICADEKMPPRGELSGQESNGDMDAPWSGMYHNMNSSTSYDLIARETWASDGSELDTAEKPEQINDIDEKVKIQLPARSYKCSTCNKSFDCPKERRVHRSKEHPMPSTATSKTQKIRKQVTTLAIKKEEKGEELIYHSEVVTAQVSVPIGSALEDILDVGLDKDKLKSELVIKEEPRKRRRDYLCPVCKVEFPNEVLFHAHLKLHPLECLTCGKYFYRRANLQLHLRTHLAVKNYKCEVCEKRFTTKQKLVEHHNVHTGAAPVKCSLCSATFRRHSNMIQHRNRHHFHIKKKLRDYVCQCGEVFHSRRKLCWHRETHDGRPKACTYCSDKFVHAASLTRHIRRAHNSYYVPDDARARENIECPICKQVYLKNNIEMHLQTHTGKKLFSCVICNKSFSTKWNLKLHHWTHANRSAKPYKCALCKGAFIRHADYVSHMNAHKSVRPYTCNYCGCQFIRKYNCQRHVKEHETSKKYVCKVAECGKTFHRSYYLTEHMRVHSGARPYSCNICGKTSSNKSNHNKHVKIHHARVPVATEG